MTKSPHIESSAVLTDILSDEQIVKLAIQSEFQQRAPKKIFPAIFARQLLSEAISHSPSYNDLAASMEKDTGISVSKQAICERVDESCVRFVERILAKVISAQISPHLLSNNKRHDLLCQRMLVQDSTVLRLPLQLFNTFSGVSNAHKSVCNARVQCVYDLMDENFVHFSIDSYSKNDIAAAPQLQLRHGDLVLRDRGYLSTGEIQRHVDAGADCIYRHKTRTIYFDTQTSEVFPLAAKLKRDGQLDCQVLLNNDRRTSVRLVAVPVNEETANLRRMKAKRECKGHAPSKKVLALMAWTIFITTIPPERASFDDLLNIYGLRWRIENIFKTWKSNMSFAAIHNVSEHQLRSIIIARLIALVAIFHRIYAPLRHRVCTIFAKHLSMMKLLRYLQVNQERIAPLLLLAAGRLHDESLLAAIARYCVYDSRKKRLNYTQMQEKVFTRMALP